MEKTTAATSEGIDETLQIHLADMESRPAATDTIPVPLNDAALARHTRLQALRDELSDLQARLGDITVRAANAGRETASAVRSGAARVDASAHAQLGSYPWAKLGSAALATFIGTRLIRMLPFGGIASVVAPIVIAQVRQRNERNER